MLAGEKDLSEAANLKIRCQVCGLSFANETEKQKHLELEHMKKKKPAGVR
jgi:predicted restriction endonuclease